jgi:hypothetical protein
MAERTQLRVELHVPTLVVQNGFPLVFFRLVLHQLEVVVELS